MTTAKTRKPKVQAKISKAKDLETHITTQFAAGVEFVEIRDFVPSTGVYGRGIAFEKRHIGQIAESLIDLDRRISPSAVETQIPGQQSLDV